VEQNGDQGNILKLPFVIWTDLSIAFCVHWDAFVKAISGLNPLAKNAVRAAEKMQPVP
jgi:hypothetical protein